MANDIWSLAFRCHFIPFWAHSASHRLRASRLDAAQYAAIHRLNAATRLTLLLTDAERMALQRTALRTPSAGILTLEEAAKTLGIAGVQGSSCNGGGKGPCDGVRVIGDAGAKNAARLLTFCRSAWLSEELLIYDLGESTRQMQTRALLRRLLCSADTPLSSVPEHARNLCVCIECRRVTNAVANDAGVKWKHVFNELGTSGSMVSINCETRDLELRCAKRSSASLRTAVAFEGEMSERAVEGDAIDEDAIHAMLVDSATGQETGASARVRRDAKSSLEQRVTSVACGHERMLSLPIVGRAVRLWGEWYALCSFCGCTMRFHPSNRVGGELCCMRCDHRMLHRDEAQPASARDAAAAATATSAPTCRFCGKRDPQRSGAKWRMVRAPLDVSGANASLPPPLRTVFFCPAHYRAWIPLSMKTEPTRVILSHICLGARPCYMAEVDGVPNGKRRQALRPPTLPPPQGTSSVKRLKRKRR